MWHHHPYLSTCTNRHTGRGAEQLFSRFENTKTHLQVQPLQSPALLGITWKHWSWLYPWAVVKPCAEEVAGFLTKLSNHSLTHGSAWRPQLSYSSPQKTAINSFSDYRPIALTSLIMNGCCAGQRSVSHHIRDCLSLSLNPHQFAYSTNRPRGCYCLHTSHNAEPLGE